MGKKREKSETYRPGLHDPKGLWADLIRITKEKGLEKVLDALKGKPATETTKEERTADSWVIEKEGTEIRTKEQLIKACKIDTNIWEVSSFRVSTWQQNSKTDGLKQLFAVKANLSLKKESHIERLAKRLENGLYAYKAPKLNTKGAQRQTQTSNHCSIINLYDAHLDKITRYTETGQSSDIDKNCNLFSDTFTKLLTLSNNPEVIILPIGNDLFNINDARSTTKKGTPQETYLHHVDTFEIVLNLLRGLIDKAARVAPVKILMIAGNHDEDLIHLLGVAFSAIYRDSNRVSIDYSRRKRKYIQYVNNLFMFSHGDKMKSKVGHIPEIIAQEQPKKWASTSFRYAFFGDIHHQKEYQFLRGQDFIGVKAKFLRAVCASDAWHDASGYIGIQKTAELYNVSPCGKMFKTVELSF